MEVIMSSIVHGYEYDIFISYRKKDNEYDGWVTEFVNNLRREMHATLKEEISLYFDENPQDGLLETHIVDKSLESKLNCLVFIPIISQTYCDIKCYAWQYEFHAFNQKAKDDSFGRDVKLLSGNESPSYFAAALYTAMGEKDKAILLLERSLSNREIEMQWLKVEPLFRPLHGDPRFENILKKIGF
jgi:6-pyruvoyl-tetrahydropterin synthase